MVTSLRPASDQARMPGNHARPVVFRGGSIRTGDGGTVQELALADGRVVAVGDGASDAVSDAQVVDLDGACLVPAFRDGHVHPLWGGVELADAPVRDCTSVAEVVSAVRRFAAEHPEREWILGGSFDPALQPNGRYDAQWLDEACAARPVVLTTSDHHAIWCNSEALRRAGVDGSTPDPPTGRIERRPDGSPLGTLVEWEAMSLVERHVPARSDVEKRAGLAAAAELLAQAGVAWVQEAALAPDDVAVYRAVADAGELRVRANIALRAEPGQWQEQVPQFVAARESLVGRDDLSARTVKFFADGTVEHGTAAMLSPYTDAPHSCGLPVWDADELTDAVAAFDAVGFQVHIHAIGDAGIRHALDAVEQAGRRNGPRDRRPVLAHVHVVHPDDRGRFAELGVIANVEPLWAQLDECMLHLTLPRLADERAGWQYPIASLLRSGAAVSFGSDWPVSSLRPLDYVPVAVHRQTVQGAPAGGWLPDERIAFAEAWAAATRGTAHQAFDDDAGALLPGMRGDLVQLSADPFEVPPHDVPSVEVLATWVSGQEVWAR